MSKAKAPSRIGGDDALTDDELGKVAGGGIKLDGVDGESTTRITRVKSSSHHGQPARPRYPGPKSNFDRRTHQSGYALNPASGYCGSLGLSRSWLSASAAAQASMPWHLL